MVTGRVGVRARVRDRVRATVGVKVKVRATGMSDMSASVEGLQWGWGGVGGQGGKW